MSCTQDCCSSFVLLSTATVALARWLMTSQWTSAKSCSRHFSFRYQGIFSQLLYPPQPTICICPIVLCLFLRIVLCWLGIGAAAKFWEAGDNCSSLHFLLLLLPITVWKALLDAATVIFWKTIQLLYPPQPATQICPDSCSWFLSLGWLSWSVKYSWLIRTYQFYLLPYRLFGFLYKNFNLFLLSQNIWILKFWQIGQSHYI